MTLHLEHTASAKASGGNGASTETELKLIVPADRLAALSSSDVIERHARNRGTVRQLNAVYYDTPDRALWRAGFVLRVRKKGSRYTMTVKSTGPVDNDLLGRGEWEASVPGIEPAIAMLASQLPQDFPDVAQETLRPIFATEVRRRARMLDLPDASIELAVDEGRIVADDRTAPISELEFELESGEPTALYDLALDLIEHGPADVSLRSKAARGFDLALDRPPAYVKPGKSGVDRKASLDDALASILGASLRHLLENKPAAIDGRDPEGVHQVRVALRRLRAILKVMAKAIGAPEAAVFGRDARWLASQHGDARNWDVFLCETIYAVERSCPEGGDFNALRDAASRQREGGYAKARAALADPRAQRFQLMLARWIERRSWGFAAPEQALSTLKAPAGGFAATVLEAQHRKVLKRGKRFNRMSTEQRHELRLAVKKLRYLTDFLLPICATGKKAAAYAKSLSRLQDGLGRYNDMATTASLLQAVANDEAPRGLHAACGAIRGWQARDLAELETGLQALWDKFRDHKKPW
ncbi:CHAD domain-containing protein [Nitratireductor mangrovi]|uniref:CHAD domain-containing protein n=1 Tax=Nitratireductor mangrovi TaxID=2599600 RepID=A0A5B8KZJ1_9HYPH|nr:CYTH and CHAD domain-containing protein [Nitratireductor mangrovi]QDZ00860.1 CHAD domain-containing protein [Nitratireductor mangrovi]